MFRRIEPAPAAGTLVFDGRSIAFQAGDSVATALIAAGVGRFRDHPRDAAPRAPYCMMGVCFECLVEIDGRQNQQACLIPARDGMVVHVQTGARQIPERGHDR
ncbi:(2Fe-2S)-binding protein [Ancylobacter moscoviensis]